MQIIKLWDSRYMRTLTFKEFEEGKKIQLPFKRPDTLSPLKVYVQIEPIEFDFDDINRHLGKKIDGFVYQFTYKSIDYIPKNITAYSNKMYAFIPLKSFNDVSTFLDTRPNLHNDFGGIFQFSKLMLDKDGNRALLLVRDTRHPLDSVESLYLLEKKKGKWIVVKSFGISMS